MEVFQYNELTVKFTSAVNRFSIIKKDKFISLSPVTLDIILALLPIDSDYRVVVHQGPSNIEVYRYSEKIVLRFANFAAKTHGTVIEINNEELQQLKLMRYDISHFIAHGKFISATYLPSMPVETIEPVPSTSTPVSDVAPAVVFNPNIVLPTPGTSQAGYTYFAS